MTARALLPVRGDHDEAARWAPVHRIVGPLADRAATAPLYAEGATWGAVQPTGTGLRRTPVAPAFGRASFATYFNAFPAAYWRRWTPATRVRLRLEVDAPATVVIRASDAEAADRSIAVALLAPFEPAVLDVELEAFDAGGLLWFDLHGGETPVALVEGAWEVDAPARTDGGLLLGMPTLDRPSFVADTLQRVLEAPDLGRVLDGFVLVDQGEVPATDDARVAALLGRLPEVAVRRQGNLGGSGGFSRVLLEATRSEAAFVTLLDDDIVLEPESLLRAREFGRRTSAPAIVGGQMLDLSRPTVLHSAAESVDRTRFWWSATAPEHDRPDLAARPLRTLPWLHRRLDADFAGWWMCQIPVAEIARIGLALPLFLKWDDAEFGLRAADAGVPTVSLPGTAVWHVAWAEKDDMLEWPAFFHARNRLASALLHRGGRRTVGESLLLDLKHLLSMQYATVALRHRALAALLDGPSALDAAPVDAAAARSLVAGASDLHRHDPTEVPWARDAGVGPLTPELRPDGGAFTLWLLASVARHLLHPVRSDRLSARLSAGRRRWWVLPAHDSVLSPTADRAAYFWYRRDRARFRAMLAASLRLHGRLLLAWTPLGAVWRGAAARIASPEAWEERFSR